MNIFIFLEKYILDFIQKQIAYKLKRKLIYLNMINTITALKLCLMNIKMNIQLKAYGIEL